MSTNWRKPDWSTRGWLRVIALTAVGTAVCIAVAMAFDSYSFATGQWAWGPRPMNNVLIPLILAPPFFFVLLAKLRELAIAQHELLNIASTDTLTACLNRRAFTAMVEAYLGRVASEQARAEGALLVIDVDHFKKVNDRFGHDSGDDALRLIVGTIRSAVREIDLVGRMGGEEFCVFLPGARPDHAARVAERIRAAVHDAAFAPEGRPYPLTVSIGGTTFSRKATFSELYRLADQQLYAAKRLGRDRVDMEAAPASSDAPPMMLH